MYKLIYRSCIKAIYPINICLFVIIHNDNKYNKIYIYPISINCVIFEFEIISWFKLNQFRSIIVIEPPLAFLTTTFKLVHKINKFLERPHLFQTLLLILWTFSNHCIPLLKALKTNVTLPTSQFLPPICFEPT
jgi:hypothetical protein